MLFLIRFLFHTFWESVSVCKSLTAKHHTIEYKSKRERKSRRSNTLVLEEWINVAAESNEWKINDQICNKKLKDSTETLVEYLY